MAAAGMTNREIAQALFVTIKAIAYHLTHVYEKLNITGRAQLVGALGDITSATQVSVRQTNSLERATPRVGEHVAKATVLPDP